MYYFYCVHTNVFTSIDNIQVQTKKMPWPGHTIIFCLKTGYNNLITFPLVSAQYSEQKEILKYIMRKLYYKFEHLLENIYNYSIQCLVHRSGNTKDKVRDKFI